MQLRSLEIQCQVEVLAVTTREIKFSLRLSDWIKKTFMNIELMKQNHY